MVLMLTDGQMVISFMHVEGRDKCLENAFCYSEIETFFYCLVNLHNMKSIRKLTHSDETQHLAHRHCDYNVSCLLS